MNKNYFQCFLWEKGRKRRKNPRFCVSFPFHIQVPRPSSYEKCLFLVKLFFIDRHLFQLKSLKIKKVSAKQPKYCPTDTRVLGKKRYKKKTKLLKIISINWSIDTPFFVGKPFIRVMSVNAIVFFHLLNYLLLSNIISYNFSKVWKVKKVRI